MYLQDTHSVPDGKVVGVESGDWGLEIGECGVEGRGRAKL